MFIKKGLLAFTPNQLALLRISVTSIVLLPLLLLKKYRITNKKLWPWIIVIGLLGSGIPPFLFSKAQLYIDSAIAGILNTLTPVFTLIIGIILFKNKAVKIQIIGLFTALFGAVILITLGAGSINTFHYMALLIILATLCYASSVNLVKEKANKINPIALTVNSFLVIGFLAMIALPFTEIERTANHPEFVTSLVSILLLSIVGTAIATILFYKLVSKSSALFSSTVTYLIPVVAIILGLLDNEKITFFHLIGLSMILLGVYLIGKKKLAN